jgi:alpha-methylacyl-CoA racemase
MGPLNGTRVVELAGVGPPVFCGMMLSDLGAEVVVIDKPPEKATAYYAKSDAQQRNILRRGRRSIVLDLKSDVGRDVALRLVDRSDVMIEGFRPGTAERLGLGPAVCCDRNQRLVYARVTGWGQDGALASNPGHDLNFIAVAGALHLFGRAGNPPQIPANLVGDYGAGGMLAVTGVLAALVDRQESGRGQVVDIAAMDGVSLLLASVYGRFQSGNWQDERGVNSSDSGRPFYDVYETSDGKFMAIAAVEDAFFSELLEVLELSPDEVGDQSDPSRWPALRERLTSLFKTKSRDYWCRVFDGKNACVTPVLSLSELYRHPLLRTRRSYVKRWEMRQPSPAPRFSRTPGALTRPPPAVGEHSREVLSELGYTSHEVEMITQAFK